MTVICEECGQTKGGVQYLRHKLEKANTEYSRLMRKMLLLRRQLESMLLFELNPESRKKQKYLTNKQVTNLVRRRTTSRKYTKTKE